MTTVDRKTFLFSGILFISAFLWYQHGLFPVIYGGDTGELVVSAHILGIPHAPGYPLFNLLGKIFDTVIPWGNPAYRINSTASFLGALSLSIFFIVLRQFNLSAWNSFLATLFLSHIPIFFEQSLVAEVFMLNTVCALLILLILSAPAYSARQWYLVSLIFGLSLGNHHTLVLIIPALHCVIEKRRTFWLVILYCAAGTAAFFSIKTALLILGGGMAVFYSLNPLSMHTIRIACMSSVWCIAGLALYTYLAIRARMDPAINFGDPETIHNLWAVLSRREFGSLTLHPTALSFRNFDTLWSQCLAYGYAMIKQCGIGGLLISGIGMYEAIKKKHAWFLVLWFLIAGPLFIIYSNLSPNALALWRLERFHLLPLLGIAVCFGYGLVVIERVVSTKIKNTIINRAVLFVIVIVCIVPLPRFKDTRHQIYLWDFGKNILRSIPFKGNLILDTILFDEYSSSVAYATVVEKKRNDSHIIARSGTMLENIYDKNLQYMTEEERMNIIIQTEQTRYEQSNKPLYYAIMDRQRLPQGEYQYAGLITARGIQKKGYSPFFVRRDFFEHKKNLNDYPTRLLLVHYPYFTAKMYAEKKDIFKANLYFKQSLRCGEDMEWLLYNIGSVYSQLGIIEAAEEYYMKSLYVDPFFPEAYHGLGYVYFQKKMYQEAEAVFLHVKKLKPYYAETYYNLGIVQWCLGKKDSARESWNYYLTLKPHGEQAEVIRSYLQ